MPLPGGGTTRIKRCQSIWSNHIPRSMRIRWAMVHFGRMGSPNIYDRCFLLQNYGNPFEDAQRALATPAPRPKADPPRVIRPTVPARPPRVPSRQLPLF